MIAGSRVESEVKEGSNWTLSVGSRRLMTLNSRNFPTTPAADGKNVSQHDDPDRALLA